MLDDRTWETQYQLVMALGATGSREDLQRLQELALQPRVPVVVNCALGDTIVRLGRTHPHDPEPVLWCHRQDVDFLAEGAQRAVAVLRMRLPREGALVVIAEADRRLTDPDHPLDELGVFALIAAAGWSGPHVEQFLGRFVADHRESVADAARKARAGTYREDRYL